MRRPIGMILIGLGAFLLTLAPLVRFYVADQVIAAPLNRYQVTLLESKNSTYFDQADLKTKTGVTLQAKNTVRGDVRANEGNDDIAVWDSTTNIYDQANPDNPIQIQAFRLAFDRRTSVLTDCCGTHVDGDNGVRMTGAYGLLLPLANVEKKSYPVFDQTTKQTAPMEFNAVEEVHGLTTYRFTQTIPLTKTAAMDAKLPAKMLGLPEDTPAQKVDRYTEAYNTTWVDPRTGVPVKHRKNIRSTVQTEDGKGKMIVAQADLITIDKDQKAGVDLADSTALKIDAVRSYIPGAAILFGLFLLGVGVFLGLGRAAAPPPPAAPRRSDGKFGDTAPSGPPGSAPPGSRPPAPGPAAGPAPQQSRPAPASQRQQRKASGPARRR